MLISILGKLRRTAAALAAAFALCALPAHATVYELVEGEPQVFGLDEVVQTRYEDTLLDLARKFSLGYEELTRVNPGVDPWLPGEGTKIVVPGRRILPPGPHEGVIVDLPEHRLYYFPKPKKGERPVVLTFPVSVGKMDWRTPIGTTRVVTKQKNPSWFPPASVRKEHAERGEPLPAVVPPGPDNPLGAFAMRLDIKPGAYLIHGTNNPAAVGMPVTHGCIRMYPEDIAALFPLVPVGTKVTIMNEPVKVAFVDGELLLEVHPPVDAEGQTMAVDVTEFERRLDEVLGATTTAINWDIALEVLASAQGMPTLVGLQADVEGPADGLLPASEGVPEGAPAASPGSATVAAPAAAPVPAPAGGPAVAPGAATAPPAAVPPAASPGRAAASPVQVSAASPSSPQWGAPPAALRCVLRRPGGPRASVRSRRIQSRGFVMLRRVVIRRAIQRAVPRAIPRALPRALALAVPVACLALGAFPRVLEAAATARAEYDAAIRATPDLRHGAELYGTCAACHGPRGEGEEDGNVPAIAGQHLRVTVKQITDFRHDARWDVRMEHFTDRHHLAGPQDIADVAAWVASLERPFPVGIGPGNAVSRGASVYFRDCEVCHGPVGEGDAAHVVPRIGGQHYEYLVRQFYDAVDGRRPNMDRQHVSLLARLERDDVVGVADYLSRLAPKADAAPAR